MAMDPQFKTWLVDQHVSKSALKAMQKEAVTNETTLRAMRDEDLTSLKEKYKLPMGQHVILRNARDELQTRGSNVEVLKAPPQPGPVEHERYAGHATYPEPDQAKQRRRLRREEIREKYNLSRGNGASAVSRTTPSPLQPTTPRPPAADRTDGGLAITSHMRELRLKGEERGKKLSALEAQTERLKGSAMDFEAMCAQAADKYKKGKKKGKKNKSGTLEPQAEPHVPAPSRVRRSATMQPSLSSSAHTRSQLQSPLPPPSASLRPESDPIRRSPRFMDYGSTAGERPRSPSPISLSYNTRDEVLRYCPSPPPVEVEKGKKCSCCVVM